MLFFGCAVPSFSVELNYVRLRLTSLLRGPSFAPLAVHYAKRNLRSLRSLDVSLARRATLLGFRVVRWFLLFLTQNVLFLFHNSL